MATPEQAPDLNQPNPIGFMNLAFAGVSYAIASSTTLNASPFHTAPSHMGDLSRSNLPQIQYALQSGDNEKIRGFLIDLMMRVAGKSEEEAEALINSCWGLINTILRFDTPALRQQLAGILGENVVKQLFEFVDRIKNPLGPSAELFNILADAQQSAGSVEQAKTATNYILQSGNGQFPDTTAYAATSAAKLMAQETGWDLNFSAGTSQLESQSESAARALTDPATLEAIRLDYNAVNPDAQINVDEDGGIAQADLGKLQQHTAALLEGISVADAAWQKQHSSALQMLAPIEAYRIDAENAVKQEADKVHALSREIRATGLVAKSAMTNEEWGAFRSKFQNEEDALASLGADVAKQQGYRISQGDVLGAAQAARYQSELAVSANLTQSQATQQLSYIGQELGPERAYLTESAAGLSLARQVGLREAGVEVTQMDRLAIVQQATRVASSGQAGSLAAFTSMILEDDAGNTRQHALYTLQQKLRNGKTLSADEQEIVNGWYTNPSAMVTDISEAFDEDASKVNRVLFDKNQQKASMAILDTNAQTGINAAVYNAGSDQYYKELWNQERVDIAMGQLMTGTSEVASVNGLLSNTDIQNLGERGLLYDFYNKTLKQAELNTLSATQRQAYDAIGQANGPTVEDAKRAGVDLQAKMGIDPDQARRQRQNAVQVSGGTLVSAQNRSDVDRDRQQIPTTIPGAMDGGDAVDIVSAVVNPEGTSPTVLGQAKSTYNWLTSMVEPLSASILGMFGLGDKGSQPMPKPAEGASPPAPESAPTESEESSSEVPQRTVANASLDEFAQVLAATLSDTLRNASTSV